MIPDELGWVFIILLLAVVCHWSGQCDQLIGIKVEGELLIINTIG